MLRRYTPLKSRIQLKRTPLKRVSAKKRIADAEYAKIRKEVLDACKHICQARIPGVCMVRAVHVHHLRNRSQIGKGKHDPSNLIGVCGSCHDEIHKNVGRAVELGLTIQRKGKS